MNWDSNKVKNENDKELETLSNEAEVLVEEQKEKLDLYEEVQKESKESQDKLLDELYKLQTGRDFAKEEWVELDLRTSEEIAADVLRLSHKTLGATEQRTDEDDNSGERTLDDHRAEQYESSREAGLTDYDPYENYNN